MTTMHKANVERLSYTLAAHALVDELVKMWGPADTYALLWTLFFASDRRLEAPKRGAGRPRKVDRAAR